MTVTPEVLERRLADDIRSLGELLDDESFCAELYRGLADVKWHRDEGAAAVSWKRAEELINEARAARGRPRMTLAQTGGEGQVRPRGRDARRARVVARTAGYQPPRRRARRQPRRPPAPGRGRTPGPGRRSRGV